MDNTALPHSLGNMNTGQVDDFDQKIMRIKTTNVQELQFQLESESQVIYEGFNVAHK